jgi:hypothetical protein
MICCGPAPPPPPLPEELLEPLVLDAEVEFALLDEEDEDDDAVSPDEVELALVDDPPLPEGLSLPQAPMEAAAVAQRETSKKEGVR